MGRQIDADAFDKRVRLAVGLCEEELTEDFKDGISTILEMMKTAPTVDAVPVRHERWIDIDSEMYTWKIRCSKCGHERSMMSTGQIYPMYCENCGARMDWKDGEHETD